MKDTLTKTAPPRLWLQVDTGASKDYRDEPFPADIDGVTWHNEEIGGLEVEYVRADLVKNLINATRNVLALSDRKHDAWDQAKAAIAKATGAA